MGWVGVALLLEIIESHLGGFGIKLVTWQVAGAFTFGFSGLGVQVAKFRHFVRVRLGPQATGFYWMG